MPAAPAGPVRGWLIKPTLKTYEEHWLELDPDVSAEISGRMMIASAGGCIPPQPIYSQVCSGSGNPHAEAMREMLKREPSMRSWGLSIGATPLRWVPNGDTCTSGELFYRRSDGSETSFRFGSWISRRTAPRTNYILHDAYVTPATAAIAPISVYARDIDEDVRGVPPGGKLARVHRQDHPVESRVQIPPRPRVGSEIFRTSSSFPFSSASRSLLCVHPPCPSGCALWM